MRWAWISLTIATLSALAMGQQIQLKGRLITEDRKPVPNTRVGIADESARTDGNGRFTIALSSKLRDDERLIVIVEKKDWVINQPLDGEFTLATISQKDRQSFEVIIAPLGSKALWTDARIEKELSQQSNQAKGFAADEFMQELAQRYGSTPEVTKEAFNNWAATQNNIGNTLKEQASSVEGPEAARLFGQAASAYRRALLISTRDSMPQDWATTQHSLGYTLQEQGVRTNGPDAARLLSDAVAAYKQALSIRTREQLPLHWAMTQNDLGNSLQAQGVRAAGPEARPLLAEAIAAYGEALLVFTRDFMPRQWAMTQHNLGSALHEQGTRTDGPEGLKILGEAVAAYRQALLVRTREQMPQQWAITQNNLANALQAQGTRADKPESLRLLDEALTAYRQSLLVFTREQTPRLWAMTKHNVGSALQEKGTRADALEAQRLFGEAVAAYRDALSVWTRQQLPQQWAMAQNNLARAYFNLKEWSSAADCYRSVLADDGFDARIKVPIGALEIATLVALDRPAEVESRLKSLIEMVEKQPSNFRVQWSFAGIQHVISQDPQFTRQREWLLELFAAFRAEDRDALITRLRSASLKN